MIPVYTSIFDPIMLNFQDNQKISCEFFGLKSTYRIWYQWPKWVIGGAFSSKNRMAGRPE